MTNQERIQARIKRDKERRMKKRIERNKECDNYDTFTTMDKYYHSLKKCQKGTMWKGKPQRYCMTPFTNLHITLDKVRNGILPPLKNSKSITIYERGKKRNIVPIAFDDRITQRAICDNILIPTIAPTLIYDNGASTKDKGVDFARNRTYAAVNRMVSKYGEDFYILSFDFKDFFNSIPHSTCQYVLDKAFTDKRIVKIIMDIVRSYQAADINKIEDTKIRQDMLQKLYNNESSGICLGSQVSQVLALLVPNDLDHLIKDKLGMKEYIRYMDDGIIMHYDKHILHEVYETAQIMCQKLGLNFNVKKTKIVKATKGFTFLKIKYRVSGKRIIRTLTKSGTIRQRRKLKRFKRLVECGYMTYDDVFNSMQSWMPRLERAKAYHIKKNMIKLYNELFCGYRITKKYEHLKKGGRLNDALLQSDTRWQYHWNWNNRQHESVAT